MTRSEEPLLAVEGLRRTYGERAALADLRLTLRAGEALALIGPNGSGKTTALRTIGGLLTPTDGTVRVDGVDPHTEPEAAAARAVTAFVSDAPVFYRDLTVAEHVFLVAVAHGTADTAAIDGVLTELGLDGHRDGLPLELSAGLQQRAQLACVLVRPHRLLLLDEPTLRLDPPGRELLLRLLVRERESGVALLLSTHDLELVRELCGRAILLREGEVKASGVPGKVLGSAAAAEVGFS